MRKTPIAVLLALSVAAFAGTPQTAVLAVEKLTCAMCSITVEKALRKVAGVSLAKVDYDKKTATVQFDPDKTNPAALVKATTEAGFPSKPQNSGAR